MQGGDSGSCPCCDLPVTRHPGPGMRLESPKSGGPQVGGRHQAVPKPTVPPAATAHPGWGRGQGQGQLSPGTVPRAPSLPLGFSRLPSKALRRRTADLCGQRGTTPQKTPHKHQKNHVTTLKKPLRPPPKSPHNPPPKTLITPQKNPHKPSKISSQTLKNPSQLPQKTSHNPSKIPQKTAHNPQKTPKPPQKTLATPPKKPSQLPKKPLSPPK